MKKKTAVFSGFCLFVFGLTMVMADTSNHDHSGANLLVSSKPTIGIPAHQKGMKVVVQKLVQRHPLYPSISSLPKTRSRLSFMLILK
jgi:hypothetical protein